MRRYFLSAICVVVCVALHMGWKEVIAVYRSNFRTSRMETTSTEDDRPRDNEREMLYWTDLYAPLASTVDSTSLEVSTIAEIDELITSESIIFLASPSTDWIQVQNQTEYRVESRAVKSNSMSITENPMIRITLPPLPCHSAPHMLEHLVSTRALMDTFFPFFHLYEAKFAGALTVSTPDEENGDSDVTPPINCDAADADAADAPVVKTVDIDVSSELHSDISPDVDDSTASEDASGVAAGRQDKQSVALTAVDGDFTAAELRTIIAPLIWPLEEKQLTLLNLLDLHKGLYRSRSIEMSATGGYSLATTSMSLVVNITSSPRSDETDAVDCSCQVLLHAANVLPHPLLTFLYETDYLAPRAAAFFGGYSKHFFPELMPKAPIKKGPRLF